MGNIPATSSNLLAKTSTIASNSKVLVQIILQQQTS
jgi:hypothetical protein